MNSQITISFEKNTNEIHFVKCYYKDGKVDFAKMIHIESFYESDIVISGEIIIAKKGDVLKLYPLDNCTCNML